MPTTSRITPGDDVVQAIMKLTNGNPGAVSVCARLAKRERGFMLLLDLDAHGIYGPDIWIMYKDQCEQSIERMAQAIADLNTAN